MKKRVLAGMRASGRLHLGNYLGGAKGMLALQENNDYETLYMVADVHGITAPYKVEELRINKREIFIDYLSVGLDPEKSIVFMQSDVPEQVEMSFYLSSVVSMYRMQHLPTFKDEVSKHPDDVTMALLNYPVLMASDILIYKAGLVPVGIDQEPHLEVAREIARKMNERYGTDFPDPKRFTVEGNEYIPSLLGEGKMSKSVPGSFISLASTLPEVHLGTAKIPTDSGHGNQIPNTGGVPVLLNMVGIFEGNDKKIEYENQYLNSMIKYKNVKEELAESIYKKLKPIQDKRKMFENDPSLVDKIIKEGAEKARKIASETVKEVKVKMGLS